MKKYLMKIPKNRFLFVSKLFFKISLQKKQNRKIKNGEYFNSPFLLKPILSPNFQSFFRLKESRRIQDEIEHLERRIFYDVMP